MEPPARASPGQGETQRAKALQQGWREVAPELRKGRLYSNPLPTQGINSEGRQGRSLQPPPSRHLPGSNTAASGRELGWVWEGWEGEEPCQFQGGSFTQVRPLPDQESDGRGWRERQVLLRSSLVDSEAHSPPALPCLSTR